jgi:putative transposase
MKYEFMIEQADGFSISRMCGVLGVSRSGYYAWQKRPPSQQIQANEQLVKEIQQVYQASRKTYGSPRIHWVLKREAIPCSRKRVARLMRLHGLKGSLPGDDTRVLPSAKQESVQPRICLTNTLWQKHPIRSGWQI